MVSGRKSKVSSKCGSCHDNLGLEKQRVQKNLGIGRKIWHVARKLRFHRYIDSDLTTWRRKNKR